jgi:hypothetical protein
MGSRAAKRATLSTPLLKGRRRNVAAHQQWKSTATFIRAKNPRKNKKRVKKRVLFCLPGKE